MFKWFSNYFNNAHTNEVITQDVFIPSGIPKYTKILIEEHEQIFNNFLHSPNQHLLIHGPSKSGKTTLWGAKFTEDKIIKIPARDDMSLQDLYIEIVDELDIFFTHAKEATEEIKITFQNEIKSKLGISELRNQSNTELKSGKKTSQNRLVTPQLSARNLNKFIKYSNKIVVFENIRKRLTKYRLRNFRKILTRKTSRFPFPRLKKIT